MKILITGGLGFIGSNLAELLIKKGNRITIYDVGPKYGGNYHNIKQFKNQIDFVKGDINNLEKVSKIVKNKDTIFCCAGQVSSINSLKDPFLDIKINALGNLNFLQACKLSKTNAPIIFLSSRTVYGIPKYLPINEEHPTKPFDGYGISKLTAENYFLLYHRHHDLNTCVLRLGNAYGPRQQLMVGEYQITGWIYRRIFKQEPLIIYGNGKQARDFVFVDDVCDAMIKASEKISKSAGNVFNVGSGTSFSLNYLIKQVSKIVKKSPIIKYQPYPKERLLTEVKSIQLDTKKIKRKLGWKNHTKLKDGLEIMNQFYISDNNLKYYI